MTKDQINKTNMFQTTALVLVNPANKAIWSTLPAFVRAQTAHASSLNVLAALAGSQGTPVTGITLDKDRLKSSVISRILVVAGAAGSYAFEVKNHTLAAKFEVKEGALKNLRDSVLDDFAQVIHDEAAALVTANAAQLAEFNLTPAILSDLQSAITAYSATVGTPRAAIADRSGITEAIAAEIDHADGNLKNILDRLILQFQADHPAFTTAYATARKLVNSGGSHAPTQPAPPTP